jgi:hypothetical protein
MTSTDDEDVRVLITRQPGDEVIEDGFGGVSRVIDVNTTVGISGRYRCTAMHPVCGRQESDLDISTTSRFMHTFNAVSVSATR